MPIVVATGAALVPVGTAPPPPPPPAAVFPVVEVYGQLTDPLGNPAQGSLVVTAIPPAGQTGVVSYPDAQQEFAIPVQIVVPEEAAGNYTMRLPAAAALRPIGSRYRVQRQPTGGSVLTDVISVPGTAAREWLPNLIVAA